MPDLQEARLGQQVSEYRLLCKLGGGFGTVYLAEHLHDRTQPTVKVLAIRRTLGEDFEDFMSEIS